jgi:hypothetical protein
MPLWKTAKQLLGWVERFFIYRVLSLDDTPHRIALGVAIAVFVTWTPTVGLQMLLTVAVATLLRANKLVGLPFCWLSNPATFVPIYIPNYWVGCKLLGRTPDGWSTIVDAMHFSGGWLERTATWYQTVSEIFWELLLGSVVVALVLSVMSYFAVYRMVVVHRERWHRKHPGVLAPPPRDPQQRKEWLRRVRELRTRHRAKLRESEPPKPPRSA